MTEAAWQPLRPEELAALLRGLPARWWVAGGFALELHLGRGLREHGDIDATVLRGDQLLLRRHLAAWDIRIAHAGLLEPWDEGDRLELPRSGLWARRDPEGPWQVQFLLADSSGDHWYYRRDPGVTLPISELGLTSAEGIPYVRPEVILLWKSHAPRPQDEADLAAVLPELGPEERHRLASWLPPGHAWLDRVG